MQAVDAQRRHPRRPGPQHRLHTAGASTQTPLCHLLLLLLVCLFACLLACLLACSPFLFTYLFVHAPSWEQLDCATTAVGRVIDGPDLRLPSDGRGNKTIVWAGTLVYGRLSQAMHPPLRPLVIPAATHFEWGKPSRPGPPLLGRSSPVSPLLQISLYGFQEAVELF